MPALLPLVLLAATPVAAPIVRPAIVPPPVFNPYPVAAERENLPPVPLKIVVQLGRETLWSGSLSAGAAPARMTLNEAVDKGRDCEGPSYRAAMRTIEVTINRQPYRDKDGFSLNARYSRPASDGICPIGTRQVSMEQVVSLPSGSVTIEGDGGFRVTITR